MQMGFYMVVVPFTAGLVFILGYFFVRCFVWLNRLKREEKIRILRRIPSVHSLRAMREIIMESLLHRKVFRINPLLGYMHMSLAFGWLLLIVAGNIEAFLSRPGTIHPPYYPIFFRYFEPDADFIGSSWFLFLMDLILLFVLSGVALAFYKRFRSVSLGLKKTTSLLWNDKVALYSLWAIFPLRLLAESITSGNAGNGSFITGSLGYALSSFLPLAGLENTAWSLYSFALGAFFFALPFSRYMHIPTEIILIFLRNYGIKTEKKYSSFSEIEVNSCSRCGICLDPCPMNAAGIDNIQSVYFIRDIRNGVLNQDLMQNCLMCGRCKEVCPVGVDTNSLRQLKRQRFKKGKSIYEYITPTPVIKAGVAYFAGCMGQLTPTVTMSMERIMETARERYIFLDKDKTVCCGRPLQLNGREKEAANLIKVNREMILSTGAKILVTSCPFCFKMFNEEYDLGIKVMHHSQYLKHLHDKGRIHLNQTNKSMVYHDPCELGRGSGVYEEPRDLISHLGRSVEPEMHKEKSICCGGSLGNIMLSTGERKKITGLALENLTRDNPDQIITGCPVCKKTLAGEASRPVKDIAEIVAQALVIPEKKHVYQQELEKITT